MIRVGADAAARVRAVFREASETLAVVLYQQARAGIRMHTDGSELPPALLTRHDRQVLKSGFRSIFDCSNLRQNANGWKGCEPARIHRTIPAALRADVAR
jgi:hypothetical protein